MQKISNPAPLFLNARGTLLDGGRIWIGVANADPEEQPLPVFYDRVLTIAAAQPLRTIGGQIVNENQSPTFVFIAEDDYSIRVRDADGSQVNSVAAVADQAVEFQPLDTDLTAIAVLATTPFGRNLLTLANQAALKAATGIPDCLPLSGGTITGTVFHANSGEYLYNMDPDLFGRVFRSPSSAPDPTGAPGDIWITWDA